MIYSYELMTRTYLDILKLQDEIKLLEHKIKRGGFFRSPRTKWRQSIEVKKNRILFLEKQYEKYRLDVEKELIDNQNHEEILKLSERLRLMPGVFGPEFHPCSVKKD